MRKMSMETKRNEKMCFSPWSLKYAHDRKTTVVWKIGNFTVRLRTNFVTGEGGNLYLAP